jgi:hypothetical protein
MTEKLHVTLLLLMRTHTHTHDRPTGCRSVTRDITSWTEGHGNCSLQYCVCRDVFRLPTCEVRQVLTVGQNDTLTAHVLLEPDVCSVPDMAVRYSKFCY